ncbi:MAG: T9SS type A sorting domain-containing protein, partial [Bacteroidota bacterium]
MQDAEAQRYIDEITQEVNVIPNVQYGRNITVIGGASNIVDTPLIADIYMPMMDDVTDRPLVIYAHTGSFLPRGFNGGTTGEKDDYTVSEVCTRLAKRGYVAAAISYRKGWNPLDSTLAGRTIGLINAAYRGTQDFRSAVRFFRKSVAEDGNPYGIDPNRISGWGQGTGGYIVLGAATLEQDDIYIPKFQDVVSGAPFVDTNLVGNVDGTNLKPLNLPNTPGYDSDIQFGFQHGGALGDTSWIDENTPPFAAVHLVRDPFAPFGVNPVDGSVNCEGTVIVPTTQEPVVDVAGPNCFMREMNALGVNDVLATADLSDPINQRIGSVPFSTDHFYPLWTDNPASGPWDFWDANFWSMHPIFGDLHSTSLLFNPDMSLTKANAYIDTLMAVFLPRAYVALSLQPNPVEMNLTFEAPNTNYQVFEFGGVLASIIDNPDQSGENTSARVVRMEKMTGSEIWGGAAMPLDVPLDPNEGPVFSVQVWSPRADVPILMKIENEGASMTAEVTANTTVANAWETLLFDMRESTVGTYDPAVEYKQVVLFPDFGTSGSDEVWFFDNVNYDMGVGFNEEYAEEAFFNVFPNPVSERLNVNFRLTETTQVGFRVVNALGQTVKTIAPITEFEGDQNSAIDVSDLTPGVHYLLLDLGGNLVSRRVFVKK